MSDVVDSPNVQGAFAFAAAPARTWSDEQRAIFDYFGQGLPYNHAFIDAYAGTGKSTTVVEAVRHYLAAYPRARVLTCAFNVRARDDLAAKFAALGEMRPDVKTLHQVGMRMVSSRFRSTRVDSGKARRIAREVCGPDDKKRTKPKRKFGMPKPQTYAGMAAQLASLAKNTLAASQEDLERLAFAHGIMTEFDYDPKVLTLTEAVLERMLRETETVDFDDQLWIPVRYGIDPPYRYDLVVVDEVQDMNPAQLWLADRTLDEYGRIVLVGDRNQAIYEWRGADLRNFERMLAAVPVRFPLTTTYRCARRIVEDAQQFVEDYKAAPDAPEGRITHCNLSDMFASAKPGDFVLSRLRAPLMTICLGFLRRDIPARIAGKELAKTLRSFIESADAETVLDLRTWIRAYVKEQQKAIDAEVDAGARDSALDDSIDKAMTVAALCEGVSTMPALYERLDRLFAEDSEERDVVVCSTVHQAKGREADRVFLLKNTFNRDTQENRNIYYVAITRARSELVYVIDEAPSQMPTAEKRSKQPASDGYYDLD